MKVVELIDKLMDYNLSANVKVTAHNKDYDFSLAWGGAEGDTKKTTDIVSLYVDKLCMNERSEEQMAKYLLQYADKENRWIWKDWLTSDNLKLILNTAHKMKDKEPELAVRVVDQDNWTIIIRVF